MEHALFCHNFQGAKGKHKESMECNKTHVTQEGFACLKKETVKSGAPSIPTIFLRAQPCLGFYFYILMISFNINCTAILYYSEKHSSSALTNSKHVDAVFLNKFAVKGIAYSVVVHILWKCLFKLMQYSMVYPERFKEAADLLLGDCFFCILQQCPLEYY